MAEKYAATFDGAGPSFTDTLRAAADTVADPIAGMLTVAAWRIDRLVQRVAIATGVPEGTVRLSEGLGADLSPQDGPGGHRDTRNGAPIAPGAVSGAVVADSARIAPRPEPERHGWYDTAGWEHRDDAHRVTFEGEGA